MVNLKGREVQRKFFVDLMEAEKQRMSAEHFIKVVLPISQDNKMLIRALERLHKSVVLTISSILQFEYLNKRVRLSREKDKNLEVFFDKCASRYGLERKDFKVLREMLLLGRKHRESGFEFSRKKGFVILDDDLKHYSVNLNKLDEFFRIDKILIRNAQKQFKTR